MNDISHLPFGSLMGGALSPLTDVEIAITSAITLTQASIGRMHVCSGTSAAYTVGLPDVDGNAGKFIGFRMSSALTNLVTLQGNNSQNIDGQNTRVMWANETAILYCDGVAWAKVFGKSIPMYAAMKKTAAQSISNNSNTIVTMDTSLFDNTALMANTSTGKISIQRSGAYACQAVVNIDLNSTLTITGGVAKNSAGGGDNPNASSTAQCAFPQANGSGIFSCSAGDNIVAWVYQNSGSSQNTRAIATVLPTLSATEILSW